MPLTQGSNGISAINFEHIQWLPEYPASHELGHATIVNFQNRPQTTRAEAVQMMSDVSRILILIIG